jgi:hypothetical protein
VARGRSVRDCVVWAIIIGGHALLVIVFTSDKRQSLPAVTDVPSPGVLIFLDEPQSEGASAPAPAEAPALASVPLFTPRLPTPETDSGSTAITVPPEEEPEAAGSNAIDWKLEAERSAHVIAEQSSKRGPRRKLGEHPVSPFREKPKQKEFTWDPEPPKAGFAQGLIPYVRIGQRCVVGLGFFGCNLSKLPQGNSHLFDGMHDLDRNRSSVPDIDTSSALDPPPD